MHRANGSRIAEVRRSRTAVWKVAGNVELQEA
jgi:hypothetical protein